jgi:hypothetical protein
MEKKIARVDSSKVDKSEYYRHQKAIVQKMKDIKASGIATQEDLTILKGRTALLAKETDRALTEGVARDAGHDAQLRAQAGGIATAQGSANAANARAAAAQRSARAANRAAANARARAVQAERNMAARAAALHAEFEARVAELRQEFRALSLEQQAGELFNMEYTDWRVFHAAKGIASVETRNALEPFRSFFRSMLENPSRADLGTTYQSYLYLRFHAEEEYRSNTTVLNALPARVERVEASVTELLAKARQAKTD